MPGISGTLTDNAFDLDALFLGGESEVLDLPFDGFFPAAAAEEEEDEVDIDGSWRQLTNWRQLDGKYRPPGDYQYLSNGKISTKGQAETGFIESTHEERYGVDRKYKASGSIKLGGKIGNVFAISGTKSYVAYGRTGFLGVAKTGYIVSYINSEYLTDPQKSAIREAQELAFLLNI